MQWLLYKDKKIEYGFGTKFLKKADVYGQRTICKVRKVAVKSPSRMMTHFVGRRSDHATLSPKGDTGICRQGHGEVCRGTEHGFVVGCSHRQLRTD